MVLGNEGTVYTLPGRCAWEGKNGCIYWKWLLRFSSQSSHIWQAPLVFLSQRNAFFFFFIWTHLLRVTESERERGEYFGLLPFLGNNLCSCCQECRLFSLLIMYNTHESPLHPVIGNIHLFITTCWIFMSGDFGVYAWKEKPSCLDINLRVRCHHWSHEPQVWMSYK